MKTNKEPSPWIIPVTLLGLCLGPIGWIAVVIWWTKMNSDYCKENNIVDDSNIVRDVAVACVICDVLNKK